SESSSFSLDCPVFLSKDKTGNKRVVCGYATLDPRIRPLPFDPFADVYWRCATGWIRFRIFVPKIDDFLRCANTDVLPPASGHSSAVNTSRVSSRPVIERISKIAGHVIEGTMGTPPN